ncbi:MAG: zinc ribbon domain-containing protein, partial [Aeromonadaceae bacterium]
PTIVSPALFEEVQHLVGTRSKHSGSYRKGTYSNLFSGVLRCQCGELLRYHNKGKAGNPRNYLVCPKQNIPGCNLPNMLYDKVEPQLLQAVSLLSVVMGKRRASTEKTLALKDELAVLKKKLEIEAKKRNKAAQSMLELDDDAVFRELYTQCKANCQALEEKIRQLEDDIMGRELSEKSLGKMILPNDLNNTDQRQRFNSQLKAAVKEISITTTDDSVAAIFTDRDGQFMLEQAFKPKLVGSSIRDRSGEELLRTTSEAPYIDAAWVKGETDEYESHRKDASSGLDDEFEDLSLQESK